MLSYNDDVRLTVDPNTDNPFLQGPFRPTSRQWTSDYGDLEVVGEIPRDLNGVFVRNTHNQVHEPLGIYHPFDGDGMLVGVQFEDGKARFRNRFVQTTGFLAEQAAGRSLWPGLLEPALAERRGWGSIGAMKDNAGTDVIQHNGKLLACMGQGSEAWRLDPETLETLGTDPNWSRLVRDGVGPHFKVDSATGDMMFFNFPEHPPYMNYGVVDRNNKLVVFEPIELPGARWPHDIGITANYSILHDLPLYFEPEGLKRGEHKLQFNHALPARFGIIPRFGKSSDVRWFEATSCYILHLANCYEDGDEIVMDGCIMPEHKMIPVGQNDGGRQAIYQRIRANLDKHNNKTLMHRWRFNLKTGQTREQYLDDEVSEFPTVSNDFAAARYRYSYNVLYEPGEWLFNGLKKYDLESGAQQRFEYGPGRFGSEPQMARRDRAVEEDDGYVISLVADMNKDRSEVLIFDAKQVDKGPLATVILPERLSVGTHACWVEADRISGERPVA